MAVILRSGTTTDEQTVDPTSKAARVTLYDSAGNLVRKNFLGMYMTPIIVRQTTAAAANVVSWALWNQNGTRTVLVHGVHLTLFFDGVAEATLMRYELAKATGVTVFSAGNVVTDVKKRTSLAAAVSGTARVLDTGLTLTGATYVELTPAFPQGRVTQTTTVFSAVQYSLSFQDILGSPVELANEEAFCLRNDVTAVIGDNVAGYVVWDEV